MTKLNVGIIGLGNMGAHHARVYSEMPQVNLAAVSDIEKEKGEETAKKYHCLFFDDYKKMLRDVRLDAVSIAVPTFLHHQVVSDVLEKGINGLVEKPIAANLSQAQDIIKRAEKKNLKLMVGHIERFNPAIKRLKDLIVAGRLGDIVSINVKRVGGLPPQRKGANVVIDLAIHDIDVANYLLREYPREVYGFKSRNLISDQEDSAVLLLKYAKTSCFIEVNWVTPVKIRTLDITGTKSFARLDYINQTIVLYESNYPSQTSQYSNFNEFISKFSSADEIKVAVEKAEPLRKELEEFVEAILDNRPPLITGQDGYRALEIALRI